MKRALLIRIKDILGRIETELNRIQGRCNACGQVKHRVLIPAKGFRNHDRCGECGQMKPMQTVDRHGTVSNLPEFNHPARGRSTASRGR